MQIIDIWFITTFTDTTVNKLFDQLISTLMKKLGSARHFWYLFLLENIKVITTGTFSFQDGTDAVICSLVNRTTLVGYYPIEGYETPVRTMQVN